MILKALIIDDEPLAHVVINEYAKELPFLEIVGECHLAVEAISILNEQEIDVLFLDINMPKLTGLDFLRSLKIIPKVIITSAHPEFALESFDLDVCDYLLKPFRFDRFLKAVNKVHELLQLETITKSSADSVSSDDQQLFIKSEKRLINILLSEIYYLESYGNYVKVWLEDAFHLTPKTLSYFNETLPSTDFFRIHKSIILNRRYIKYVEGNFVIMKNETQLPIGKNQRNSFKEFLA